MLSPPPVWLKLTIPGTFSVTPSPADGGGVHQQPTNVCGQPYSWQIRSQVSNEGERDPVSSSRYSRTLTLTNDAARASRGPHRSRSRLSISGSEASEATSDSLMRVQDAKRPIGREAPQPDGI
jgi:hypothetical protein